MAYIDGFIIAAPTADKDKFVDLPIAEQGA